MAATETVAVVGAGFSGIGMGVLLKRAGIESFTILEKAADVGGTWRENTYPGAACDVPSHLYSFSFEPKPDWSRAFSPQQEIWDYLRHCVAKYDLARHIRFGARVTGAAFDPRAGVWTVRIEGREPMTARALVLGNGALHVPSPPDIPGLGDFRGRCFHSAEWDHAYDVAGKRVAVIGTGASAIQIVPAIAPRVERLTVFQRTPPWIVPRRDRAIPRWQQTLFRRVRPLHWLYRASLYWMLELRGVGLFLEPRLMRIFEWLVKRQLAEAVRDPVLRAKVTPTYTMGCKRILLSNDWYETLQRPNVALVTEPIERATPDGIRTRDGVEHRVDAIVCATGFMVSEYLSRIDVVGRDGRTLNDAVHAHAGTNLGITVHGFPNLFLLMGPNTGLGHNSMIFMIEAQARYAVQAIQALRRRNLLFLEVRERVQRRFEARVQEKLRRTVWTSGCRSWYAPDGYNGTIWPHFSFQYWWRTRRLALEDYELVAGPAAAGPAPRAVAARAAAP